MLETKLNDLNENYSKFTHCKRQRTEFIFWQILNETIIERESIEVKKVKSHFKDHPPECDSKCEKANLHPLSGLVFSLNKLALKNFVLV